MSKIVAADQLTEYLGREQGPTEWITLDQDRINLFADATLDHQFIHVDEEKARQTPFGSTIAHGFLSLSLLPHFLSQVGVLPEGVQMAMNYGLDKVRFLQPVKMGSQVRATQKLVEVVEKAPGQILCKNEVTVEIKGEKKPALIAELLSLLFIAE